MRAASKCLGRDSKAGVSIIFAAAALPLVMGVGLAIDYSTYIQAQAQLDLAADAGALHAVRIASANFVTGGENADQAGADGQEAGSSWFQAQFGTLPNAQSAYPVIGSVVAYDPGTSTFTSTISYTSTITPRFSNLFSAASAWSVSGSSSAVITVNSFAEIDMLMDNSSSMLIGASPQDIISLENLTVCPPYAVANPVGHNSYNEFSWNFPANYGFDTGQTVPTPLNQGSGVCDPNFTGGAAQCPYPPLLTGNLKNLAGTVLKGIAQGVDANGFCPVNTGKPTSAVDKAGKPVIDSLTGKTANVPSAPCGFACHGDTTPNDYYTLLTNARAKGASINLRFDVIQSAAAQVVQTMKTKQQVPNQFTLGVFTFNNAVAQVHPASGGGYLPADTNLDKGLADIKAILPPSVSDNPNTNFPGAMSYLAANFTPAGDGTAPTTPRKNLFIITDGLEDYSPASRFIGQMTSVANESNCAPLKAKGYNIFVLYTPYYPLPNPFYLSYAKPSVELPNSNPGSVAAALQACASKPTQYYQASSGADIDTALQAMLASALNSPGRISN